IAGLLTADEMHRGCEHPLPIGEEALAEDLAPELELQEVGMQRRVASLGRTPRAGGLLRSGRDIGPRPRLAGDSPSPRHRHDRAEVAVDPALDTLAFTHRTLPPRRRSP